MVLTSPEHHITPNRPPPPTRGMTLPQTILRQSHNDLMVSSARVPRAHTLPNSNRSLSTIDLNNAINNNQLLRTRSPGGGHSVSIMSLPQSDDNEAFSFDNRYVKKALSNSSNLYKFVISVHYNWRMKMRTFIWVCPHRPHQSPMRLFSTTLTSTAVAKRRPSLPMKCRKFPPASANTRLAIAMSDRLLHDLPVFGIAFWAAWNLWWVWWTNLENKAIFKKVKKVLAYTRYLPLEAFSKNFSGEAWKNHFCFLNLV